MLRENKEEAAPRQGRDFGTVLKTKSTVLNFWNYKGVVPQDATVENQNIPTARRDRPRILHEIYAWILFYLQAIEIRFKDKIIPFILHEDAKEGLRADGWSEQEIEKEEADIISVLKYSINKNIYINVPAELQKEIEDGGGDPYYLIEHQITPIPGRLTNLFLCSELAKKFSREALDSCGIFTRTIDTDEVGDYETLKIDIDDWIHRHGFFQPCIKNGMIYALKVHRRLSDEKPFLLRSRVKVIDKRNLGANAI